MKEFILSIKFVHNLHYNKNFLNAGVRKKGLKFFHSLKWAHPWLVFIRSHSVPISPLLSITRHLSLTHTHRLAFGCWRQPNTGESVLEWVLMFRNDTHRFFPPESSSAPKGEASRGLCKALNDKVTPDVQSVASRRGTGSRSLVPTTCWCPSCWSHIWGDHVCV